VLARWLPGHSVAVQALPQHRPSPARRASIPVPESGSNASRSWRIRTTRKVATLPW